jgi:hypothetical protein
MLASIPVWVPVVFLALVFLGYRQSITRTVRPGILVGVALGMLGFSLYGIFGSFGPDPLAILLWASSYAAAAAIGKRLVGSRGWLVVGSSVRIPGSWVPMVLLLTIFAAKFVLASAAAMHSPVFQQIWFVALMSSALGALSGGFGARALAVHRRVMAAGQTAS